MSMERQGGRMSDGPGSYPALIERSPEPMAVLDREARLLHANPAMLAVFGIATTAYRGRSLLDLVGPDGFHHPAAAYATRLDAEAIADGGVQRQRQVMPQPGGHVRVFDVVRTPGDGTDGAALLVQAHEVDASVEAVADVARRRRFELAGRLALGVASRTRELAHRIQAIRPPPGEGLVGAAAVLEGLAGRILDMAQDLPAQSTSFDLMSLVDDIARLFRPTLPSRISLTLALPEERFECVGDPAVLAQALLSSLCAAEMSLPERAMITLGLRRDGPSAELSITLQADTGTPQIVLPEQAAIAAAAMGGHIRFSTMPDGSRVDLVLPMSTKVPRAETSRPRLLVVDDEQEIRELIHLLLSNTWAVTCCASADEAMESSTCDVALIDVNLPRMDGVTLALALRRARPGLPVLLMSGNIDDARLDDVRDSGEVRCIAKPFTAALLDQTLRLVMGGNVSRKRSARLRTGPGG